ncbi:hypothetical protein D3C72_1310680 [compost metagenome]
MHGIGRHDRYCLNTIVALSFGPSHLLEVGVGTRWRHTVRLCGGQVALCIAGKYSGNQFEVTIQMGRIAVGGTDGRLQASADKAQAQALGWVGQGFHALPPWCVRN